MSITSDSTITTMDQSLYRKLCAATERMDWFMVMDQLSKYGLQAVLKEDVPVQPADSTLASMLFGRMLDR